MDNYDEQIYYNDEELAELLKRTKKFLDRAYSDTKISRYGKEQADRAMFEFFTKCDFGSFTNEQTRQKFEAFTYHGNEIYQVLLDFAISSYIADKKKGISHRISSLDEVNAYHDPNNQNLNYEPKHVIEVVALLTAQNSYYALNVLGYNEKLRQVLVENFVKERYGSFERRQELDNTPNSTLVHLDSGKTLIMSKTKLNKDINNMINDDDYGTGYFNPEIIINSEIQTNSRH